VDSALLALTGSASWHGAGASLAGGRSLETSTAAGVSGTDAGTLTASDLADLRRLVNGGRAANAPARGADPTAAGLIESHAYTVLGVSADGQVTLRNPWGSDGPQVQGANDGVVTVSWDVFSRVMQGFCVA